VGDNFFSPSTVNINPGDTVLWNWVGGNPHSTTSGTNCNYNGPGPNTWDSGIKSSGTFQFTFNTAGNFPYFCTPHCFIGMQGTVNVTSSSLPLKGFLENPLDGQNVSGITTIHGWGIDGKGITKVELYVDGQFIGIIPYGGTRGDIKNAFPNYPNAENSGFGILINYSVLSSGNHAIKARLYNQDGHTLDLNASVNVKKFHGEFVTNANPATWTLSNEVVTVGGTNRNYDIVIQWSNATQGFEITEIIQK
jgi:hypothetical protein